jgi:hypothetical protein
MRMVSGLFAVCLPGALPMSSPVGRSKDFVRGVEASASDLREPESEASFLQEQGSRRRGIAANARPMDFMRTSNYRIIHASNRFDGVFS